MTDGSLWAQVYWKQNTMEWQRNSNGMKQKRNQNEMKIGGKWNRTETIIVLQNFGDPVKVEAPRPHFHWWNGESRKCGLLSFSVLKQNWVGKMGREEVEACTRTGALVKLTANGGRHLGQSGWHQCQTKSTFRRTVARIRPSTKE